MSRTLEDVRREQRQARGRINAALGARKTSGGPGRVYREVHAEVRDLRERLARLTRKRVEGEELIASYEARIAELEAELQEITHGSKITQLVRLVRRLNSMGVEDMQARVNPLIEAQTTTRERVHEIRCFVTAFREEVRLCRRASRGAFADKEAYLQRLIDERLAALSTFLADCVDPYSTVRRERERLTRLAKEEADLTQRGSVHSLLEALELVKLLTSELGPERSAMVLSQN